MGTINLNRNLNRFPRVDLPVTMRSYDCENYNIVFQAYWVINAS